MGFVNCGGVGIGIIPLLTDALSAVFVRRHSDLHRWTGGGGSGGTLTQKPPDGHRVAGQLSGFWGQGDGSGATFMAGGMTSPVNNAPDESRCSVLRSAR